MSKLVDLTGRKFGMLTVLGFDHIDKDNGSMWSVKCDCGTLTVKRGRSMQAGATTSCGCYKPQKQERGNAAKNALYRVYKSGAVRRGYPFELTLVQFTVLTKDKCIYCGSEPDQITTFTNGYNGQYVYNGIDRFDNKLGYTLDNSAACCGTCNMMKKSMSAKEFIAKISKIYNNVYNNPILKKGIE